jgi:hydrogenase maturation protease
MSSSSQSGVLVIGIGNLLRGDDGVGRIVARHLQERAIPGLHVLELDGEITSLLETWKGLPSVIVVDAAASHSAPGTIHRFDTSNSALPGRIFQNSTHAFGLHEAVELSRALLQLPQRLLVFGIEGKSFALGGKLSPEVQQAVAKVVDRIIAEVAPLS